MEKKIIVTTGHKATNQLSSSKEFSTTKYESQNVNKGRDKSKNDCKKLMALQEALQDPITVCEGI